MQALLYTDLATKKAQESLSGSTFKFPPLNYGEDLNLSLRFAQKIDNKKIEVERVVRELRASIGRIDARPEAGKFAIKVGLLADASVVGTNVTTDLPINAKAAQIESALNALAIVGTTYGAATCEEKSGSWLVEFDGETQAVEINAESNSLFPISFLRVRASEFDGQFVHDLRLVQSPVAFTDQSAAVVPPAPVFSRLQAGGTNGEIEWTEIQKLTIPPAFRGTYQVRRAFAKTTLLDKSDDVKGLATALSSLAATGEIFETDNPTQNAFHVTFGGSMVGETFDLLGVEVFDAPAGDITFTLSLNTPEVHALLRKSEKVTLPFEIEADIEDEQDSSITYTVTLLKTTVTIERELNSAELSAAASIDWIRPPLPKNYRPFSTGQIANGQNFWAEAVGDGLLQTMTIDHNLDIDRLDVIVHANAAAGAPLVYGTDYTYTRVNSNSLDITFTGTPSLDQYLVTVLGLEMTSFFDAHTHVIGEIVNLQSTLDGFGTRLNNLEASAGNGALTTNVNAGEEIMRLTLPSKFEVFPLRGDAPQENLANLSEIDASLYPESRRAGGMLPAIHDIAAEALVIPVETPSAAHVGRLFENQTASGVILFGGRAHRGITLKAGEFCACDGNQWYRVENFNSESSYYPTIFNRTLFEIAVNEEQFRQSTEFLTDFAFECGVLHSETFAQWVLSVQFGTMPQDTTPATTGLNLKNVVWDEDNPALEQRIVLMPSASTNRFGIQITRSDADVFVTNQLKYGASSLAGKNATTGSLAMRALLHKFDTENSIADPRGLVAYTGLKAQPPKGKDSSTLGFAIIQ